MFKARPPSGNSLEAVPPRRTALPTARLLAVLAALALAAFLSGVLPVRGQTDTVLVSNTGQGDDTTISVLNTDFPKGSPGVHDRLGRWGLHAELHWH